MSNKPNVIVIVVGSEQIGSSGLLRGLIDGLQTTTEVIEKETVVEPDTKPKRRAHNSIRRLRRASTGIRFRRMRKDSSIGSAKVTMGDTFSLDDRGIWLSGPNGRRMDDDELIDDYKKAWGNTE